MQKIYSIAQARNHLTALVRAVEAGSSVELARRGKPVVVMLSIEEYSRLTHPNRSFWNAYLKFKGDSAWKEDLFSDDFVKNLRDESQARGFSW